MKFYINKYISNLQIKSPIPRKKVFPAANITSIREKQAKTQKKPASQEADLKFEFGLNHLIRETQRA
jgi:hypothetical protein